MKQRQIERLQFRLGGLRNMERLPSILFVVDVIRESTAVREANVMGIPVIAMVDTNGDPDNIDYVLPANDDAIRAIRLLTAAIADAVLEGRNLRKDEDLALEEGESAAVVHDRAYLYEDEEDEMYLGQATLAKLREGDLSFDEEEEDDSSQQRKRRK